MKVPSIIGADLSKKTIDLASHDTKSHLQIENTVAGFKLMVKWLRQQKIDISTVVIVMEHTGLYSYRFEEFLYKVQINFAKVPALAIKRSLGLVRGKNDKIDAYRIARYGFEKKDTLTMTARPSECLKRLQMLYSTREAYVKSRAGILATIEEFKQVVEKTDSIIQSRLKVIETLNDEIKNIEVEIAELVKTEKMVEQNMNLLQTIKGVGKIVALAAVIRTRNFTLFTEARKFACYCGTAPFENRSGTSIRGKNKVSHLADKKMKSLLDLSAKCAVQHDKELKTYYTRRLQEGKSKMSTLNIVRNKILGRMFAVIKRQTPFIENYLQAA